MTRSKDPVHFHNSKWYFWDETWSNRHGPFDSERDARANLLKYNHWLNHGPD